MATDTEIVMEMAMEMEMGMETDIDANFPNRTPIDDAYDITLWHRNVLGQAGLSSKLAPFTLWHRNVLGQAGLSSKLAP